MPLDNHLQSNFERNQSSMKTVNFKTQNAVFEFSRKDVIGHLNLLVTEHNSEKLAELLELIKTILHWI